MRRLDYATAAVMLLLAAAVVAGTPELDFWDDFGPGSRFMPLWVAGVTVVLAGLLVVEARQRSPHDAVDWPDRMGLRRVVMTLAGIVAFVLVAPWLGFVITTALFVVALLLIVERRALLPSLFTGLFAAALIHAIFVAWLSVALPKGIFGV
jgi:putative tricarboxylic transport membrane protein